MKNFSFITVIMAIVILAGCQQQQPKIKADAYPVTQKVEQTDDYFGTAVADPYRWLEDDNSAETEAWVTAENKVTFSYLEKIPFRSKIKQRLEQIWNFPKYTAPFREGDYYYFFKNDGMQNQYVLYEQKGLDGEPVVFLDPNTFSEDGTIALGDLQFSKDGKICAYSISKSGSDWNEIFVMDVETKAKKEDHLEWIKFSGIAWKDDGFYYSSYDKPSEEDALKGKNEFHKVYYHKLGTLQSDDKLVYKNDE